MPLIVSPGRRGSSSSAGSRRFISSKHMGQGSLCISDRRYWLLLLSLLLFSHHVLTFLVPSTLLVIWHLLPLPLPQRVSRDPTHSPPAEREPEAQKDVSFLYKRKEQHASPCSMLDREHLTKENREWLALLGVREQSLRQPGRKSPCREGWWAAQQSCVSWCPFTLVSRWHIEGFSPGSSTPGQVATEFQQPPENSTPTSRPQEYSWEANFMSRLPGCLELKGQGMDS